MVGDEIILEGKTDYYTINYYVAYQQQQEALPCLELVFHHHSQYVYDSEKKTLDTRRRVTIVFPFSTFVLCPNLFLLAKFLGRKTKVVVASVLSRTSRQLQLFLTLQQERIYISSSNRLTLILFSYFARVIFGVYPICRHKRCIGDVLSLSALFLEIHPKSSFFIRK